MGKIFGYGRVSTASQAVDRQLDALAAHGCEEVITDSVSGTKSERPGLRRLMDKVREGDTVVVESWSRLGRSTRDLLELVDRLNEMGVTVVSIKEAFDTATPQGRLMVTLFQAFAQFERDLISQRTRESLQSARARGRCGGRPTKPKRDVDAALKLYDAREYSVSQICRMTGLSASTLYRYVRGRG